MERPATEIMHPNGSKQLFLSWILRGGNLNLLWHIISSMLIEMFLYSYLGLNKTGLSYAVKQKFLRTTFKN